MHMDKITAYIYKYLWHLLHYLVFLYEFVYWLRLRIIALALWSYDLCRTTAEREESDYDFLQKCKKRLSKIPKHVNIVIGPGNTQANEELLTRIFSYALNMNINCISYYDTRYTNTSSSSNSRRITLDKLKCPKGWKRKDINSYHSVWYVSGDKILNGTKFKTNAINGSSSKSNSTSTNGHLLQKSSVGNSTCLEIYEIQPQHNRSLLARICQDLFKQKHTTEIEDLLENRTLLTERLDKELSNHLGNLTEPELSIIFDENICTYGMLPWHTRFTEFHQYINGQRFDAKSFAHILYKYSRCEQRWGK